jgi:hypothetical protein
MFSAGLKLMLLSNDLTDTAFEGKIAEHIVLTARQQKRDA